MNLILGILSSEFREIMVHMLHGEKNISCLEFCKNDFRTDLYQKCLNVSSRYQITGRSTTICSSSRTFSWIRRQSKNWSEGIGITIFSSTRWFPNDGNVSGSRRCFGCNLSNWDFDKRRSCWSTRTFVTKRYESWGKPERTNFGTMSSYETFRSKKTISWSKWWWI